MGIFKTTVSYYRNYGFKATVRKIMGKVSSGGVGEVAQQIVNPRKNNVLDIFGYVLDTKKIPFSKEDFENNKDGQIILNWIIPEMGVGSGGHINIFRFVEMLQQRGIKNRIYVDRPVNMFTDDELRAFLRANYSLDPDEIEIHCGLSQLKFAHGTVATGWQTAYCVNNFDNTITKFYFVQDFEPYFYAPGSEYYFAENTYRMGFTGITAGDWLKDKLRTEYGMKTESVGFSYDRELYRPVQKRDDKKRIFFYARPVTPRRSFEMGLLALIELYRRIPDIEVIFAGWDVGNYEIPFIHLNGGCVKLSELSDLYSQCDMCLVLSCTNLSLLPLEVMASNSVVVSNKGSNNEWLLNSENSILTENDPIDIADKLEYYLNHKDELAAIRKNGLEFAQTTDWELYGDKMKSFITNCIEEDKKKLGGEVN